jgi:hypothetical protein
LELCCIKWMFWMTWLGHLRKKKLLMSLSASGPCSWARRFQWAFFFEKVLTHCSNWILSFGGWFSWWNRTAQEY